jgi:polyhydroxybutyrate depolymerase
MKSRLVGACVVSILIAISNGGVAGAKATPKVKAKPSDGCGASSIAAGEEKITTTSGGVERWYFRHVPPVHDGKKPLPLVLDLHGYVEGASVHKTHSALGPFGDEKGFVTITPQGSGDKVAQWNVQPDGPDMVFIGDLLDEVQSDLCIDERRVFVTGLSMGAFMTSAIVCKYSDRIAAAAPVAGIRDVEGCKLSRPVPIVAFHGTEDPFIAFDGGVGPAVANLPRPDGSGPIGDSASDQPKGPSVPKITAAWAKRNGCGPKPSEKSIASDVTLVAFDCPRRGETELYRVEGGGHTWPGSEFSKTTERLTGVTTFSINADEVMWEFFRRHPLRG